MLPKVFAPYYYAINVKVVMIYRTPNNAQRDFA